MVQIYIGFQSNPDSYRDASLRLELSTGKHLINLEEEGCFGCSNVQGIRMLTIKTIFTINILTLKITKMKTENEKIALMDLDENLKKLMSASSYKIGDYTFDVEKRMLQFKEESIKLTAKESYLLVYFNANTNNLLTRNDILTTIWKVDTYSNARSLDVYICRLRKLLSKDSNILILNLHGKGYKMIIT